MTSGEGKPTEILAVAIERAKPAQMALLEQVGQSDLSDSDLEKIIEILNETGALHFIEQKIALLVETSHSEAEKLPFAGDVKSTLQALAHYVACRNH